MSTLYDNCKNESIKAWIKQIKIHIKCNIKKIVMNPIKGKGKI